MAMSSKYDVVSTINTPGNPLKDAAFLLQKHNVLPRKQYIYPFKWAMFLYHMLRIFPFAAAFLNMQNSRQTHQRDIVPGTNPVKMTVPAFWNSSAFPTPVSRLHDALLRRLGWQRLCHPHESDIVS